MLIGGEKLSFRASCTLLTPVFASRRSHACGMHTQTAAVSAANAKTKMLVACT